MAPLWDTEAWIKLVPTKPRGRRREREGAAERLGYDWGRARSKEGRRNEREGGDVKGDEDGGEGDKRGQHGRRRRKLGNDEKMEEE